jgi:hypothetical protein
VAALCLRQEEFLAGTAEVLQALAGGRLPGRVFGIDFGRQGL